MYVFIHIMETTQWNAEFCRFPIGQYKLLRYLFVEIKLYDSAISTLYYGVIIIQI